MSAPLRRARVALGTLVEIGVVDGDCAEALAAAFAVIDRIERQMSRQRADSELAALNGADAGAVVPVGADLRAVLERAREFHALSAGAFDVSCGSARGACGYTLHAHGASRDARSVQLSLDGIAKGYAVDRAIDALRAHGATAGWVNAGGDLRAFGDLELPVQVRIGRRYRAVALRDHALATSEFGRTRRTRAQSELRGTRRARHRAATVVADECIVADAMTKVAAIDGAGARAMLAALGARLLFAD